MVSSSSCASSQPGGRKLSVKSEKCPQNHPCPSVKVCPTGALSQSGLSAPSVAAELCTACGACARFCPMGALVLE